MPTIDTYRVILNFISSQQEELILNNLRKDLVNITYGKGNGKRTGIFRFGLKKHHPDRLVGEIIPDYLSLDIGIPYNSVTINKYEAGDIIDWHIDKPNTGETISVLSLLSDADIFFRNKKYKSSIIEIPLPRCSLIKFSNEIRYEWEHYLQAADKRWSIVYRNIKG